MYTEGSSALKTEYYTLDAPKKRTSAKTKKARVSSAKASRKKVLKIKKRIVAAILLAFAMAFTVLYRYAAITAEYNKLSRTKERVELMTAKVVEKQVKAEGNMDPKRVEQEAIRLGLRQPSKNQIAYISLGNTDGGEVLKVEEKSSFSAFINRASVILEYLY
ncbi:MAG: hypothetical protein E7406_04725 [Ruminococcaceae bacterium]|nr:hypothetical protein [Oscillospiraceae bacterium]